MAPGMTQRGCTYFLPSYVIRWGRRYRLRLQVLSGLALISFFIGSINSLFEYLLQSPRFQEGALKITGAHFRRPQRSLFLPSNWGLFLNRVTAGKSGILGEPWLYIGLLALFVLLSLWVFFRLTPPEDDAKGREYSRDPGDNP
jgi:hypothetical protein